LFAAVSAAQAFTVEETHAPGGGQGYLESDKPTVPDRHVPVSRFGTENGQTTYKSGNNTFYFGNQRSFDQKYSTDNIFNPYAREGR
jgi:hypothetical protein